MLGLDPDPAALWPGPRPRGAGEARLAAREHGRGRGRALPGRDRGGRAGLRGGQAPARLLRAARRARAGRRSSATAAIARDHGLLVIADGKRGDVPVTAAAYAQALVGETPGPFGAVPGLGADAFTANPLLGRDALEPLVEAARAAGAGLLRARAHLQPRRGRAPGPRASRRCTSGWRGWSTSSAPTPAATAGSRSSGAVTGATQPRAARAAARADAARDLPAARRRRPGRPRGGPRRRPSRPTPPRGLVTASRSIVNAHARARGRARRAPRPPRRRSCARPRGSVYGGLRGAAPYAAPRRPGARCTRPATAAPLAFSRRSRWWSVALAVVARRGRARATAATTATASDAAADRGGTAAEHRHHDHADHAAPRAPTRSRPATRSARSPRRPASTVERLQELNPELDPQALCRARRSSCASDARARASPSTAAVARRGAAGCAQPPAAAGRRRSRRRRGDRGRRERRARAATRAAADERRAIASTTKLMTALLALERARPGEVFTAPAYDAAPGGVADRPARRASG